MKKIRIIVTDAYDIEVEDHVTAEGLQSDEDACGCRARDLIQSGGEHRPEYSTLSVLELVGSGFPRKIIFEAGPRVREVTTFPPGVVVVPRENIWDVLFEKFDGIRACEVSWILFQQIARRVELTSL